MTGWQVSGPDATQYRQRFEDLCHGLQQQAGDQQQDETLVQIDPGQTEDSSCPG